MHDHAQPAGVPDSIQQWVMTAQGQPLSLRREARPPLQEGDVLVRVAGCGVCHTDLGYLFDGVRTNHPLPLTLGHEISGVVVETSPSMAHLQGQAVIVPAVLPCEACDLCRTGKGLLCRNQLMPGNDLQGGFADYVVVPGSPLAVVEPYAGNVTAPMGASGVSLVEMAVIADAVTTPYQAIVQSGLEPGELAVFIGVGGVGGFGAQIAKAMGAIVVAVDIREDRLAELRACGIEHTLDSRGMDGRAVRDHLRQVVKQTGASPYEWKLFETSGTAVGQDLAFKCLTYGATLSVVGFTMDTVQLRLSNLMAFHARALGNWGCHPRYYPDAIRLVLEGKVQLGPFVKNYPMKEINSVFQSVHQHAVSHRPVMVPDFA